MALKQSAVSGVKWSLMSTTSIAAIDFIQVTILAHLLKPTDFGLIAMASVVIALFLEYLDMGTSAALIQRNDISREQMASLYWLNVFVGLACFFVVCAMSPLVVAFFHEPLLYKILPALAANIVFMSVGLQFYWLMEKNLQFNILGKLQIFAYVVEFLVTIASAFYGLGVWSLVWGLLACSVVKNIIISWIGWTHWPPMFHFSVKDINCYIRFGLFQLGDRSIAYATGSLDKLLVGKLLGAQELGYYTFAFNEVILLAYMFNPMLMRVSFPVLSRMQNDILRLRHSYLKMITLLSTVNAPLFFGLAVVAPTIIPLIFGAKWTPAVPLVQILAIYSYIRSTCDPINSLLLAKGRVDLSFKWNLFMLTATIPVIFIGAVLHGTIGVATALVLMAACVTLVIYKYLVRPLIGSCCRDYFFAILKPVVLALIMGFCVWFISPYIADASALLAIQMVIGVSIYLFLLMSVDRTLFYEIKGYLTSGGE